MTAVNDANWSTGGSSDRRVVLFGVFRYLQSQILGPEWAKVRNVFSVEETRIARTDAPDVRLRIWQLHEVRLSQRRTRPHPLHRTWTRLWQPVRRSAVHSRRLIYSSHRVGFSNERKNLKFNLTHSTPTPLPTRKWLGRTFYLHPHPNPNISPSHPRTRHFRTLIVPAVSQFMH